MFDRFLDTLLAVRFVSFRCRPLILNITYISAELDPCVGNPSSRMGSELRGGVRAGRGGRLHRDRAEDEEAGGERRGGHKGHLQNRRGRESRPHRRQPHIQEEEAPLPIQGPELRRIYMKPKFTTTTTTTTTKTPI